MPFQLFGAAAIGAAVRTAGNYIIRYVLKPIFMMAKKTIPRLLKFMQSQMRVAKMWAKHKVKLIAAMGAKAYNRMLMLITLFKSTVRRFLGMFKKVQAQMKAVKKLLLSKIEDTKAVQKIVKVIEQLRKDYVKLFVFLTGVGKLVRKLLQATKWYERFKKTEEWLGDLLTPESEIKKQQNECDACLREEKKGDQQIMLALKTLQAVG